MARITANKVHKINLEALKQENVATKFADTISLKLDQLQNHLPLQVDEHWNKCAEIINSAEKIINEAFASSACLRDHT